jgi:hypothetical protein
MINDKDLLKFRQPLEINFIQKHIVKLSTKLTLKILNKYIKADILEEKGKYYVLKNNN